MNTQNLFAMGQQQQQAQPMPAAQQPAGGAEQWKCSCGNTATGKFCQNCGAKKPEPQTAAGGWKCQCGAVVSGKFCPECGSPKPADTDGWTCSCGAVNKGKLAGPVPAARSTKESSVRTAVRKSRKERRYTAVTSAAGSRRTRRIRRSSAPNAVTSLMTATGNNN